MAPPTRFLELNRFLGAFVARAAEVLGTTFRGAYLHGSFALGAADEHSDVDFVVVSTDEPDARRVRELGELHRRLHAQWHPWARRLEGSYVHEETFRRVDPARRPFLFLEHGSDELVADPHCNTAAVPWTVREHGVPLAGPPPATLVEPVAPADLRREALATVADYADWAREAQMSAWKQAYLVVTLCRILYTLETGAVVSKPRAVEWALRSLEPRWHELVVRAAAERADVEGRARRAADPATAAATRAFADAAASPTHAR